MTNQTNNNKKRIAILEQGIKDFRNLMEADGLQFAAQAIKHQFRSHYFVSPPLWRIALRAINAKKRAIPDFTMTGVVRSGTSNISNYLMQHPAIVLPITKELSPMPYLGLVKAQFPLLKEMEKVRQEQGIVKTGDCTPIVPSLSTIYMAQSLNPDLKIVITLRNPVKRTISHWTWSQMLTRRFHKDPLWANMPDINETLREELRSIKDFGTGFSTFSGSGQSGYIQHSIYLPYIRLLLEKFPKENIHIVSAEDFFQDPIPVVKGIYEFIGLPDFQPEILHEKNASPKTNLDPALEQELADFFEPQNQKLYDFLGRDFGW